MKEFRDDDRLYLDDLRIGQSFTSGTHVVDEEQIKAFARQFDPQPFHLDNEVARGTLFSGLAASGWHTAAITMRLLVESGLPIAGGIVGAGGELDWPNPTRPGYTLKLSLGNLGAFPKAAASAQRAPSAEDPATRGPRAPWGTMLLNGSGWDYQMPVESFSEQDRQECRTARQVPSMVQKMRRLRACRDADAVPHRKILPPFPAT